MNRLYFALLISLQLCSVSLCFRTRKLTALYNAPPISMKYHNGVLLEGDIPVSILWYGKFSPAQKAIVTDFFLSLNPREKSESTHSKSPPSVSQWWKQLQTYVKRAGKRETHVVLSSQIVVDSNSLGKILKRTQLNELAQRFNSKHGELVLVLTAPDVAVEGFCMSCGYHGAVSAASRKSPFIWVGNSVTQCPGQCAWPFHQPIYGMQSAPLVAPNGDVGVDGMIVNIASLLAGTVTNPFGNGYYQGPASAPLEAASACQGLYGKGAYPGYAGELLVDPGTGASYNAQGVNGRKYLLPALVNPLTSQCSTLV